MHHIVGHNVGLKIKTPSFQDALLQFRRWCREYPSEIIEWYQEIDGKMHYIYCQNSEI